IVTFLPERASSRAAIRPAAPAPTIRKWVLRCESIIQSPCLAPKSLRNCPPRSVRFLIGSTVSFRLRPGKCGSTSGQLTFPRYTLMQFVHALDAIFEFTAVVRKLLSHLIDAARHVATERGPDGDNLANFALVGGHQFLDLGRSMV